MCCCFSMKLNIEKNHEGHRVYSVNEFRLGFKIWHQLCKISKYMYLQGRRAFSTDNQNGNTNDNVRARQTKEQDKIGNQHNQTDIIIGFKDRDLKLTGLKKVVWNWLVSLPFFLCLSPSIKHHSAKMNMVIPQMLDSSGMYNPRQKFLNGWYYSSPNGNLELISH